MKKIKRTDIYLSKMDLLKQTERLLKKYSLDPSIDLHQNFCIDSQILQKAVDAAQLDKKDTVLEIGTGTGNLTKLLAAKAKKIISLEKDKRLEIVLQDLPKNVEIIFADALRILPTRKDYNKIVANLPYQIAEPLLKFLCTASWIERSVLMVPKKFALQVSSHPFFSAFLDFKIIAEVFKESFYPQPKVASALLLVTPKREINDHSFLLQQLFLQRDKKLKNALREALIALAEWKGTKLSKKEAKKKMEKFKLEPEESEELVKRVKLKKIDNLIKEFKELA